MASREPPRLVLVTGLSREATEVCAGRLLRAEAGVVVAHHDLSRISEGVVRRRVRRGDQDSITVLKLAHGCVSCTLQLDVLPVLRELAADPGVRRIVLHLDPSIEPEAVCWSMRHVVVGEDDSGSTVLDHAEIEAVLALVDEATWLQDATSDAALRERGLGAASEDDRAVGQVAVGQVEFADVLLVHGRASEAWLAMRTEAVLARLAPSAPRVPLSAADPGEVLALIPAAARRGAVDDAHCHLLGGQPPLEPDCGVALTLFRQRRPFHPQRLHQAIDVLLDGVVRARGRLWMASQPDVAMWLESAGGELRVGHAGRWLDAMKPGAWSQVAPERRAKASAEWDLYYGDRAQELAVLSHEADPSQISRASRRAAHR